MACGPREAGRRARQRTRSRVLLGHGEEGCPDGQAPHVSERERGEGATDWAKKKEWAGEENWAAGREEEKEGWAGLG